MSAERAYSTVDKSAWPPGPWTAEPDKIQWVDPATGLDCLIVRNPLGALCGYAGVPAEHPWHGKAYDEQVIESPDPDGWGGSIGDIVTVHGGLTYSEGCQEGDDESVGVCHVPAPGRPDDVHWFGFDCAHWRDLTPRSLSMGTPSYGEEVYRDVAYVRGQVASLAGQLAGVQS